MAEKSLMRALVAVGRGGQRIDGDDDDDDEFVVVVVVHASRMRRRLINGFSFRNIEN